MITVFKNFIKNILQFLIAGLRPFLGPGLFGPVCRYPISCTQFALEQLENKPLFTALIAITKRIFSCGPQYLKFLTLAIFILLLLRMFLLSYIH